MTLNKQHMSKIILYNELSLVDILELRSTPKENEFDLKAGEERSENLNRPMA